MSFFGNLGRNFGRGSNKRDKSKPPPGSPQGGAGGQVQQYSGTQYDNGGAAGQQQQPRARPLFLCQPFVKATLLKGSFKTIVVMPKYVDQGEWISLNVFEFFEYLRMFNGVVSEFCTHRSCPSMSAGPNVEFTWLDNQNKMSPMRLPAPDYIERVFTWINSKITDETLFPSKAVVTLPPSRPGEPTWIGKDNGFPPHFFESCQGIYTQMFRVFAHIYHTHFDKIVHLSLEAHFNSFFAHFVHFGREFALLDDKVMAPLRELIDAFDAQTGNVATTSSSSASARS